MTPGNAIAQAKLTRMISSSITPSTVTAIREFVEQRDWDQFHSPENLAKSISIEAAELLECYQWTPGIPPRNDTHVHEELADVLTYCIMLADKLGVNMDEIILAKLEKTKKKYPTDVVRDNPDEVEKLHWAARKGKKS